MAQLAKCLPRKSETLSSNPNTTHEKEEREKEKERERIQGEDRQWTQKGGRKKIQRERKEKPQVLKKDSR
jgi:hypothetical protein